MSDTLTDKQAKSAIRILARRFRKPPRKRKLRVDNLHPVVDFLFDEMDHLKLTDIELQTKAQLGTNTISNWRGGMSPRLDTLEPVLNAMGYTIAAVPMPETKE